jgi:hypothetical protein
MENRHAWRRFDATVTKLLAGSDAWIRGNITKPLERNAETSHLLRSIHQHLRCARHPIISTVASPIDAVADVTKQYVGGPMVSVARGPVNGTTRAFSFSLPASAPVRTAFAASAPSLSFTIDSGMPPGRYTLVGKAGVTIKTLEFDVSLVDFVDPTWTFT